MGTVLVIFAIISFVALVLVTAIKPVRSKYAISELKRRSKQDKAYLNELDREELYPALMTFLRMDRAILLTATVLFLIGGTGWGVGTVLSLLAAITHPLMAKAPPFPRLARHIYSKLEPKILDLTAKLEKVFNIISDGTASLNTGGREVDSIEELREIIENSKTVVSKTERDLLMSALVFSDKTVESIMTPRNVIDFIKSSEFLGPLVLDELHSLGHSRLPVIKDDLNHIVGVLHLRDLLSLDVKRSVTAEKAMEAKVYYIREDNTLEHALAAFLKARHHLFIVINKQRETVGLLTLEDVLEALIGRRIVDEDDIHADLRKVAEQEGKNNNSSANSVDV